MSKVVLEKKSKELIAEEKRLKEEKRRVKKEQKNKENHPSSWNKNKLIILNIILFVVCICAVVAQGLALTEKIPQSIAFVFIAIFAVASVTITRITRNMMNGKK